MAGGGGVFINYRTGDEPTAAAAIQAWLGQQFGKERVFRDCNSMQAGDHYPTAIRDALGRASILLAVVGPRWLTLTEPHTGVRLIDRPHDWVRMEIAIALRRRIHIVPVLVKNTPASAEPPAPADLPADIRPFATRQAFDLSQLRLGEDLARLAERLAELDPSLVDHPRATDRATTGQADPFTELVEAFLAVPSLRDERGRRIVLARLDHHIASVVPNHDNDRSHAIALVQTCLGYENGLVQLVDAVRVLAGNGPALRRLQAAADAYLSSA